MPIPPFDEQGFLPAGIHPCTMEEIKARFGTFQGTERRPRLFENLQVFVAEAKAVGIIRSILINGSFTTAAKRPNDIDLVIVVDSAFDLTADVSPRAYNILSKHRVRRKFGFDLLLAREGSLEYHRWAAFFQQIRLEPHRMKGILQLSL